MAVLRIRHATTYRYKRPVRFGEHRLMLRPKESYDQRLLASKLVISPTPAEIRYVHDVFGNCVGLVRFDRPAAELVFESTILLDHTPAPLVENDDEVIATPDSSFPAATGFPFGYGFEDMPDLLRLIERQHPDPEHAVDAWARRFVRWNGRTPALSLLVEMTRAIHGEFRYARRLEGGAQSPAETLALGSGACRDFAVLMIEAARSLGLAARFVSGYIYCPPRSKGSSSKASIGYAGGGNMHAWVQVYLPSCGWVEFDPTNGIVGNTDLVRVAEVRDPRQAIPLSGAWDGSVDDYLGMEVEVDLRAQPVATRKAA